MNIDIIYDKPAMLGEGAIWDYRNQRLLWVDILGKTLFISRPDRNEHYPLPLPSAPGTVVPIDEQHVLIALTDGIYRLNLDTREYVRVADPEPSETKITERFNDGKCDPSGRFWVGSMHDGKKAPGKAALYRIDHDFSVTTMIRNVSVSNGIVWSLDRTRMYYIDTHTLKVVAYDYDDRTGDIADPRDAIRVPESAGRPDGSTIDSEGMLWIAMWAGHSVTRWNPESGELLQTIDLPAYNVTSVAFGGRDLDELFVTTAAGKMNDEMREKYPKSGMLFRMRPGVRGVPTFYFGKNH